MRFFDLGSIQNELRTLSEEEFAELRPNPSLILEPLLTPTTFLRDTTTKVKVQVPAPPPHLHPKAQITWLIPKAPGRWPDVKLGRDPACDIFCPSPAVSKRHATLSNVHGTWVVEDHGSTNGTEISCERIVRSEPRVLPEGEPLVLAQVVVIRLYQGPRSLYTMLKSATIGV